MESRKIIGYIVNFVDEDRSQFFREFANSREFDINTDVNENGRQCVMTFYSNGSVEHRWFFNGKLHREDGPAFEYSGGSKLWFLNGKLHREDGPAVEHADGTNLWYLNGKLHREDGPAIEYASGSKEWYLKGKFHREDGPAIERANGSKLWYLNGKRLTEEEFNS
jgi:antitoxin component YwqK of YwqJK toxin-antitoxin module